MIPALLGAGLAGLVGSPHCTGMCGGFVTAAADRGWAGWWHLGRLGTYAVLGAFAGAAAGWMPGPSWIVLVPAIALLVWFSARLAGLVPETHVRIPGLTAAAARALDRPGIGSRVLFGALTGLIPCGLVYAALSFPVALGDPMRGAVAMVVFGAGTVPVLSVAAVGLRRLASTTPWVRRGVGAAVLAAGLWSLGLREMSLLQSTPDQAPVCHTPGTEGERR